MKIFFFICICNVDYLELWFAKNHRTFGLHLDHYLYSSLSFLIVIRIYIIGFMKLKFLANFVCSHFICKYLEISISVGFFAICSCLSVLSETRIKSWHITYNIIVLVSKYPTWLTDNWLFFANLMKLYLKLHFFFIRIGFVLLINVPF